MTTAAALSGDDVTLVGSTGVNLGHNVSATDALQITTTNSAVNQTAGVVTAGGATTVAAGTGDVTLAQAGNNFNSISVTGGAVSVSDTNNLTVSALTSGANQAVSLIAGGTLTLPATAINTGTAALTLQSNGGSLTTAAALSGDDVTLVGSTGVNLGHNVSATDALQITTTNSAVNQTAGVVIAGGATTVAAGTGNVTLAQAGNNFNSVAATGGAVSITDTNALVLGAIDASTLTVNAGGALTQSAAAIVRGVTSLNAAANSVILNQAANDFGSDNNLTDSQRRVDVVASDVQLVDSNQIVLGNITVANSAGTANQVLMVESGFSPVAVASSNNSELGLTGDAAYSNTAPLQPSGGGTLSLSDSAIVQAQGTMIQTGSAVASTFSATEGGSITLTGNNQLAGQVNAISGRAFNAEFSYESAKGASVVSIVNRGSIVVGNAGIEGDLIALESSGLSTNNNGVIRARLPFSTTMDSAQQLPGLLLSLVSSGQPAPLNLMFGAPSSTSNPKDGGIKVNLGDSNNSVSGLGGFVTVRPLAGASGSFAEQTIYLQGPDQTPTYRVFYDGANDSAQIPIVYNGLSLRTPEVDPGARDGRSQAVVSLISQHVGGDNVGGANSEPESVSTVYQSSVNGVILDVAPEQFQMEGSLEFISSQVDSLIEDK